MAALRWSGFTEDDLRKIREGNGYDSSESDDGPQAQPCPPVKQVTFGLPGGKKPAAKKQQSSLRSPSHRVLVISNGDSVLDPKEMLSPPKAALKSESCEAKQVRLMKVEPSHGRMPSNSNEESHNLSPVNGLPVVKLRVKSDGHSVEVLENRKRAPSKPKAKHDKKAVGGADAGDHHASNHVEEYSCWDMNDHRTEMNSTKKKLTLEEFQIRQKMIEEQNKRRRAMLSKAISDRKKKTQAETEKLTHIQKELQKLDSLVSNDVAILRNQIEVASMEFNDVQKRYEKAEREFVEAKTDLFKKMERKEQLTEYLCTIIEENEMRKAKKLAELMYELELESLIEECQEEAPVLPQLCAMNDIAYTYCTTLRDPAPRSPDDDDDHADPKPVAEPSDTEIAEQVGSCTESGDDLPNVSSQEHLENEAPNSANNDVSDASVCVENSYPSEAVGENTDGDAGLKD